MKSSILRSLIFFVAALAWTRADASEYVLKFAHPAPVTDPAHEAIELFAKDVEERSKGRINVEVFPGGQLGEAREIIQALQSGVTEAAFFSSTHLVTFAPEFGLFDLPYLVVDRGEVGPLLEGEIGSELLSGLNKINIKGLAFSEASFRSLFANRPADNLDALKGLKIRVPGSPVYLGTVQAMGALPTPIAFGELYSALQQGIVDGAENTASAYFTYRFYEVAPNWIATNHSLMPGVYLMSARFWEKLPEDLQVIVQDAAKRAALFHREKEWAAAQSSLEQAKAKGASLHVLKDVDKLVVEVHKLYPQFSQSIGEDLVARTMKSLGR